jgi:ribosome maturation factor RimP
VGGGPPLFSPELTPTEIKNLELTIETRLAELEPEVEVIALERPAAERLRLYIDRPGGVDLGLCERVSGHLRELRETYALEVSSPGLDRPLTKLEHFHRFLGRRVRVRTREPLEGRRNFTGTLTDADERGVSLDADGGAVRIPHERIRRSNLVPDSAELSR